MRTKKTRTRHERWQRRMERNMLCAIAGMGVLAVLTWMALLDALAASML